MARLAMGAATPLTEPAAYHCQHSAEKLLKGLLVGCALQVPRTHDLERLAQLLRLPLPELTADIGRLAVLSPWAEVARYPQLESDAGVSNDDVRQAIVELADLAAKAAALASRRMSREAGSPD